MSEHAQAEPVYRLPSPEAQKEATEGSKSLIWPSFGVHYRQWVEKQAGQQSPSAVSSGSSQTVPPTEGAPPAVSPKHPKSTLPRKQPRLKKAAQVQIGSMAPNVSHSTFVSPTPARPVIFSVCCDPSTHVNLFHPLLQITYARTRSFQIIKIRRRPSLSWQPRNKKKNIIRRLHERLFKNLVIIKTDDVSTLDLPHTSTGWQGLGPNLMTRSAICEAVLDGTMNKILGRFFLPVPLVKDE